MQNKTIYTANLGLPDHANRKSIQYTINENECWECCSHAINQKGYISITWQEKSFQLHRFSYQFHNNGEIDKDLKVMHSCDNKICFNPEHLSQGTDYDNAMDREEKGRGNHESKRKSNLTFEQVVEIIKSDLTNKQLSEIYDVKIRTIERHKENYRKGRGVAGNVEL